MTFVPSSALKGLWTTFNERYLRISTVAESAGFSPKGECYNYATVDYLHVYRIMRLLKLRSSDTLFDLGCGKGRIVCVASRFGVGRCVGIDIDPRLCDLARANAATMRFPHAPIEIIEGDCTTAGNFDEGTVFFFFNPFAMSIMVKVAERIRLSLASNPRPIKVVYVNARYREAFQGTWLKVSETLHTIGGNSIVIWNSEVTKAIEE